MKKETLNKINNTALLLLLLGMTLLIYQNNIRTTYLMDQNEVLAQPFWDKEPFLALEEFADNHEWIEGEYVCVDYSRDVNIMLSEMGYKSYSKCGTGSASYHEWIVLCLEQEGHEFCMDIEPQSGKIVNYDEEYSHQTIGECS